MYVFFTICQFLCMHAECDDYQCMILLLLSISGELLVGTQILGGRGTGLI